VNIMSPHKHQDGYHYVRVECDGRTDQGEQSYTFPEHFGQTDFDGTYDYLASCIMVYDDSYPESRTISSKRVEEGVELLDFKRLCSEQGLFATSVPDGTWRVYRDPFSEEDYGAGKTLREAYYRFINTEIKAEDLVEKVKKKAKKAKVRKV